MSTTVLILPGIGNSDPDHWQSRWERASPAFVRVAEGVAVDSEAVRPSVRAARSRPTGARDQDPTIRGARPPSRQLAAASKHRG